MNKKKHILLILSAVVFAIFMTGCSAKKTMTKTNLREFTANRLIQEVEKNQFEYDKLQAKLSAKIEIKNKSHNVKGHLRMEQDSIIWVSISLPVGTELFRAKITSDSVYFINKNDNNYLIESIDVLDKISPMVSSVSFIQSVLVGNDLNLRQGDDYKIQIDNYQYNLMISKKLKKSIKHNNDDWKVMMKELWIDPELYKITKYNIKEYNDSKRTIELTYSEFELINDKYIPTKINIKVHGDFNINVTINYSNISLNDKIDFNFKIPKKYERIYLDD